MMMTTMVGTVNQMLASKRFYCEVHSLEHLTDDEYMKHIKKKLTVHLKNLFKIILTNSNI